MPLSGIDGEQHGEPQIRRRYPHEPSDTFVVPNFMNTAAMVKPTALETWILYDQSAIVCPGKNPRQRGISIIGLPQRCFRQSISPFEEHRLRAWIIQRLDREIAKGTFDALYLLDVVTARAWRDPELEIGALLVTKQQCQQYAGRRRYLLSDCLVVRIYELR